MRNLQCVVLAAGLIAGTAAAQRPTQEEQESHLLFLLAAANAEGDAVTDRALAQVLGLQRESLSSLPPGAAPASARWRALLAESEVTQARLVARVEAATLDTPELLALDLGCRPVGATPDRCAQRRQRLEALAGDNAYFHMVLMTTAWQMKDADAYLKHARAGAAASYYRTFYGDYYDNLHRRFLQAPASATLAIASDPPGLPAAGVMAMSMAAQALPNYVSFSQPCRESEGELREHCLTIALMQLESSNNLLEVMIAAGVVEALGDGPERSLARSRQLTARWQQEQMGLLAEREMAGTRSQGYDAYFRDYGKKGEWLAMRELLEANGLSADPPDGWTP